jgi:rhodanese-related sulfurtransferase
MNHIFLILLIGISAFGCNTAAIPGSVTGGGSAATVTPQQAQEEVSKAYSQFIDVRTPEEFAAGHAARTRNIPLDTIEQNLDLMRRDEPVYLICRSGSRSAKAAEILKNAGFTKVFSVAGGTDAWQAAGLPMAEVNK